MTPIAESAPVRVRPARRLLDALGGPQNLSLIGALAGVLVVFGYLNPAYLSWSNLAVIGVAATIPALLAVAQTMVIICGGIDISVGSQSGLAAVVAAMVFASTGDGLANGVAVVAIAVALVVGVACGILNGLIIIYGRVNAIIGTLAMLAAYKGLAQLLSGGRAQGYLHGDDLFIFVARGSIAGLPMMVWILIAVAAAIHILLKYTDIGRNIYAIGGNATAARLAGISLNKYIVAVYAVMGFVAALAGVILAARTGSGQPTAGSEGLELKAITAAFLGGCAIAGGRGGVGGTLLAVAILSALDNGLTVVGVNPFWQNVAQGALLVVAVVVQQRRTGERAVGLPA
ncbi:MAG: ABC transporter permease [Hamadaea sp.]|uniref:ABC transporter permease n=1 Tax=Hamadaea sp. TaxID=2024425 RepID=UPI0017AEFA36|nr:ABC transporter permease [Hamadaea sp.]NUR73563.1 ABC transporter permease [Hamadaea sp.]NUT20850.1 ABC transporter permease [Hamadaea sp.]